MKPQNTVPEPTAWQQRVAQAVGSPAVSVVIVDGKKRDVIVPAAAAWAGIEALHETLEQMGTELRRRHELIGEGGKPHPLILVIEEMSFLTRSLYAHWAGQPGQSPALRALEELFCKGRSAAIYVKASE